MDKRDPLAQQILIKASKNTKDACTLLMGDTFFSPFSVLHDKIFDVIDSEHYWNAIAAPRGLGKTSIARAVAIRGILYRDYNFIVYISNSATLAEMQTETIKHELLTNKLIKSLFGSIKVSDYEGADDTFSKLSWVAFGNTFILPRGAGQQVRGLNWMGKRPDLIIVDDLEDKKEILNERIRKDQRDWFFSDVLKTESAYADHAKIIYIDTVKHEDSLLELLLNAPEWNSVRLSICDEDYNSFDSNYMTTAEIKQEVEDHRQKGLLDLFYMERMNVPIATADAVFKQEYFRYFEDNLTELLITTFDENGQVNKERVPTSRLLHVTIVDPAKTLQLHSAESAIVTIGVDRESHKLFVRDIFHGKVRPDQLYNEIFKQVTAFNSNILGVEVTSLHLFISQPLEQEMMLRHIHPVYAELNAKGKKEERIASGLASHYKMGYMYHNKANCGPLESQLLWFPRSKLWDVMDATAYITPIMDKYSYYFEPDDNYEDPSSVYNELTNEKPLVGWRIV